MKGDFKTSFENNVLDTIRKYRLLDKNDKVLVACSGGKDSTTVLYLLDKFGYKTEGIMIDLGIGNWSKTNRQNLEGFCRKNNLKLHVTEANKELGPSFCYLKTLLRKNTTLTQCHVCGILKRWLLNKKAKELDATKLAFGHNLDDEAQTGLMNIFNGNPKIGLNIGPKTGTREYRGFVTRIKPLFFTPEADIRRYSEEMGFPILYKRCPYAQDSYRAFLRNTLNVWEKKEPGVKEKIVSVSLDVIALMRKSDNRKEILECRTCGEPSNNNQCKACELLARVRS